MKKAKTVLILLLLLFVTAFVVFSPKAISNYNEKRMLSKTDYWSYDNRTNVNLTSRQVAAVFCNPENSIMSYFAYKITDSTSYIEDGINTDINSLFDTVFGKDEAVCRFVKSIIGDGIPTCTREYMLTVIEDRPVVLSLLDVSYNDSFGFLDFRYEEKTKTLISFYYSSYSEFLTNKYDSNAYGQTIPAKVIQYVISDYCKNELKLSEDEFYFENYIMGTELARQNTIEFALIRKEYDEAIQY